MATAPDFPRRLAMQGLGLALACAVSLGSVPAWGREGEPLPPGAEALAAEAARRDRLAVVYGAFYRRPTDVPARLLRLPLSADDVSVVLFIAERGSADPHAVAAARLAKRVPWHALMRAHGVRPSALLVRLDGPRPTKGPYAHAYRVLGGRVRGSLTDDDIRELVQLRLVTRHFRLAPSRVVARRTAGVRPTDLVLDADRVRGVTRDTAGGRS